MSHRPALPPVLPERTPDSQLKCPYTLCYVQADGTAVLVERSFSHTRKRLIERARQLIRVRGFERERLYIWDTSGDWRPESPSHWMPIPVHSKPRPRPCPSKCEHGVDAGFCRICDEDH